MTEISKISDSKGGWYPVSIDKLDALLIKVIYSGRGYRYTYALRRNLAYNLQYFEYLDRTLLDLKLTNVLIKQSRKTFIIIGCGIVESLLHYLLIADGSYSTTDWELITVAPGNPKNIEGEIRKIDSHIYRKLGSSRIDSMTFDAMIKKSEARRILGSDHSMYPSLKKLRGLRNKVHLQEIGNHTDTDWNAFQWSDVCSMAQVIHGIFTSNIFRPSNKEKAYFEYLLRYK